MQVLFKKIYFFLLTILFFFIFLGCISIPFKKNKIYNNQSDLTIDIEFFGMHTQKIVDEIEFKYWRLWDAGVFWPELEIKKNEWKFCSSAQSY